jgi:hypothetical protein
LIAVNDQDSANKIKDLNANILNRSETSLNDRGKALQAIARQEVADANANLESANAKLESTKISADLAKLKAKWSTAKVAAMDAKDSASRQNNDENQQALIIEVRISNLFKRKCFHV